MRMKRNLTFILSMVIAALTVLSGVTPVRAEEVVEVAEENTAGIAELYEEVGVTTPVDGETPAPEKPETPPVNPETPVVSDPDGSVVTYTVQFFVLGELVDTKTVSAGSAVEPPVVSTVTTNEAEYHFIRWIRSEDGTEPDLSVINSDLVLVAEFERIPYDEDIGDAPVKKPVKKPVTKIDDGEVIISTGSSAGPAPAPAAVVDQEELLAQLALQALLAQQMAADGTADTTGEIVQAEETVQEDTVEEPAEPAAGEEEPAVESEEEPEEVLTTIDEEEVPLAGPEDQCNVHYLLVFLTILFGGYQLVRMVVRARQIAEMTDKGDVKE